MLERKVYNNDDITFFFRILTFAKPSCDNVLQPSPLRGSGCNTLSHSVLANVNIRKRVFYPLIILTQFLFEFFAFVYKKQNKTKLWLISAIICVLYPTTYCKIIREFPLSIVLMLISIN